MHYIVLVKMNSAFSLSNPNPKKPNQSINVSGDEHQPNIKRKRNSFATYLIR